MFHKLPKIAASGLCLALVLALPLEAATINRARVASTQNGAVRSAVNPAPDRPTQVGSVRSTAMRPAPAPQVTSRAATHNHIPAPTVARRATTEPVPAATRVDISRADAEKVADERIEFLEHRLKDAEERIYSLEQHIRDITTTRDDIVVMDPDME